MKYYETFHATTICDDQPIFELNQQQKLFEESEQQALITMYDLHQKNERNEILIHELQNEVESLKTRFRYDYMPKEMQEKGYYKVMRHEDDYY